MNAVKGYSMLDHIPYDKFEYVESIDAIREPATVVRDMDAVLDYIGIGSHIRGQTYRYEKKLTEIPKDMLETYLKEVKAENRVLTEKVLKNDEIITKLNEVLAE